SRSVGQVQQRAEAEHDDWPGHRLQLAARGLSHQRDRLRRQARDCELRREESGAGTIMSPIGIRPAVPGDIPLVLKFIQELADYERLSHEVTATEDELRSTLFCVRPVAEVVIASHDDVPVGFAVFFATYSTFLGKPGLYLEDLFVRPAARGNGIGRALVEYLARLTVER